MAENTTSTIALILEDQNLHDYINFLLVGEGYEVKAFHSQDDAIKYLEKGCVDLVICEYLSANINGLNVCKILRKNLNFNMVPIFFLIPDEEPMNTARLIYAGADDYIKKSLIQEELFLKVKLILCRTIRQQDINILTRLPGQSYLLAELQNRIATKAQFAVSCIDLYRFKEFEYRYDFERGNEVIKYTAGLIAKHLKDSGDNDAFLAQTQNNEFIFITQPFKADDIVSKIIREFDQNIMTFYEPEDRSRGTISIKNRKGQVQILPFLKLRIGVVVNTYFAFFSPIKIIQIVNEIKDSVIMSHEKSVFVKEEGRGYTL